MGETAATDTGPAAQAEDWAAAFFNDADKLHLPTLMNWFGEAIDLRLGNNPPITGLDNVHQTFEQFWSTLKGMKHERQQLVVDGDTVFQGSIVTYTRLDDKQVSMPVASHLRRRADGRLDRLWIYIDMSPLFTEE
ncbi:MAG: nuclear transport factor 2 family protein [Sphingomonadaceae bacterium]|nr:nuclear transport factor 2 family protein [Sphingomonadaceae bacterium]MCP5383361.1 nuclear transport factor 2 family protein [Altererythrobacter sp.]MCP5391239.1 nuclear transport factor 2 family protein [Sphingomonadaceae bacterium]MCP5393538.1 nuclear transport factor 2 family protein [Sphingomonadaceae bacterium]